MYFSKLSLKDWQGTPPHEFQAAFKLEADMSWTEIDGDNDEADNSSNQKRPDWSETLNLSQLKNLETKSDTD